MLIQTQSIALTSFAALTIIQVSIAIAYKFAQNNEGSYPFNPAFLLVLAESLKFLLSVFLFVFVSSRASRTQNIGKTGSIETSSIETKSDSELDTSVPFTRRFYRDAFSDLISEIRASPMLIPSCTFLAAIYCANNNATFYLFSWIDGANINLFKSGCSIVSTLLLHFALDRKFSQVQWVSVGMQTIGLGVSQFGATCSNVPRLSLSLYAVLLMSIFATSVSSVLNDHILKSNGGTASLHTVNSVLYFFGAIFNASIFVLRNNGSAFSLFAGFNRLSTWVVLAFNVVIGVIVSAVYKYCDATSKTFASAFSTSILLLMNIFLYGHELKVVVVLGCLVVFASTYLFVTNPPPAPSISPPSLIEIEVEELKGQPVLRNALNQKIPHVSGSLLF